jgi:hypothetical protein
MGYYDLGKILNDYECFFLKKEIIQQESIGEFILETDNRYYTNSVAGINPTSWYLLNRFLELAAYTADKTLQIANPYTRVYKNGSSLNPHIDREGLDWTISVCIFSNIENEWPLKIKNIDDSVIESPTIQGYASLVNGRELEHWRDPLECDDRQMVIQTFLHYTEIK